MRLFVDDIRKCPEGWVPAKTVTEAIRILATQYVTEVSLDHDIACRLGNGHEHSSNETFEPVARFVALYNLMCELSSDVEGLSKERRIKARIHTANFEAGRRMADILGIEYHNYTYNKADYV